MKRSINIQMTLCAISRHCLPEKYRGVYANHPKLKELLQKLDEQELLQV